MAGESDLRYLGRIHLFEGVQANSSFPQHDHVAVAEVHFTRQSMAVAAEAVQTTTTPAEASLLVQRRETQARATGINCSAT